jgi:WXG100 family type VII secretion target
MEDLDIRPSQLHEEAKALRIVAAAMDTEFTRIEDASDGLRLQWAGAAHDAFDVAQTRARNGLEESRQRLAAAAQAADTIADAYAAADRSAAEALGGQ